MVGAQKRRKYGGFHTRGMLVLAGLLFIFLAWNAWDIYQKERAAHEKATELTRELDDLAQRKEELAAKLKKLETQEGVEAEVRQTLQVAKPGERVIVIVDPKQPTTSPLGQRTGFWERVVGWFGL